MFNFFKRSEPIAERVEPTVSVIEESPASVVESPSPTAYGNSSTPYYDSFFTGEKYQGGMGPVPIFVTDYWTLRQRSAALFKENLYFKGLIRRLITNEINTGLTPEACPDEKILGVAEDSLDEWTEMVENRFLLWGKQPVHCDYKGVSTFGELQRMVRMEALIEGDQLIFLRTHKVTGLPVVQVIGGDAVRTPFGRQYKVADGHEVKEGVELDANGKHVAFWIRQKDGTFKRLPAYGARTGQRLAWLVYGTERRRDDVRGESIGGVIMQSLKELDRYRDSAQRKALINSILAIFIKKDADVLGTKPLSGGAMARGVELGAGAPAERREFSFAKQLPGFAIEELQRGETPQAFGSEGTDVQLGPFEQIIIQSIAWANEIPPEILTLAFSNNYSASQAAINEFRMYLCLQWVKFGEAFCSPIYQAFLLAEVMRGRIKAEGFLDAWRDPEKFAEFGAWVDVDWYGSIKPSTDMYKAAKASILLTGEGWSTNQRESRTLTGTKHSKNIKKLRKENERKVEAMRPLADFKREYGETPDQLEASLSLMIDSKLEELRASDA